jgi:diacylglycerol kinase (ATP)
MWLSVRFDDDLGRKPIPTFRIDGLWIAVPRTGRAGMDRLIKAFFNSVRAFNELIRSEKAFQQEIALLVVALPLGWFLSTNWRGYGLLIGAVLLLLMVEVLNTGIEAACDAISRETNIDIRLAKDCGSLAVLISVIIVAGVWGIALAERIVGAPV